MGWIDLLSVGVSLVHQREFRDKIILLFFIHWTGGFNGLVANKHGGTEQQIFQNIKG